MGNIQEKLFLITESGAPVQHRKFLIGLWTHKLHSCDTVASECDTYLSTNWANFAEVTIILVDNKYTATH